MEGIYTVKTKIADYYFIIKNGYGIEVCKVNI
jgi:hypothetical protein